MANVRIKSPLLEKRSVKLHWFGNVRLNQRNNWRITVAFEDKKQIVKVDCPIGLLPMLRIGQWYYDGYPLSTQKEGTVGTIVIPDRTFMKSESALNICRHFNYYLYRDAELITQRISSFLVNGITYHIPHVEFIRAFFALHKSFANTMMRPNGLAFLINQTTLQNQVANIVFAREVPVSILTDDFIYHVTWLIQDLKFLSSFESVYSSVYSNFNVNHGTILTCVPPSLAGLTLTYRGITNKNEVLVQEITGISGLDFPIRAITYCHPLLRKRNYVPGVRKRQIIKQGINTVEINSESNEVPKEENRQLVIEQEPTKIGFQSKPQIVRVTNDKQKVHKGDLYITKKGRGGVIIQGGGDESIIGGNLHPVNVTSLNIERNLEQGLEKFLEMIDLLRKSHPELNISVLILDLPRGRKFSCLPSGQRRKCAIVKVDSNSRMSYILEVSCPDEHSLSTLILYPVIKDVKKHEQYIRNIFSDLIVNQGHWNYKKMKKFNFKSVRHNLDKIEAWKQKIHNLVR